MKKLEILGITDKNIYCSYYETQAGMKIARRNINNLKYVADTTLKAENKEELKSLMKREEWKS